MILPRHGSRSRAARLQAVARQERITALARSSLRLALQKIMKEAFNKAASVYVSDGMDGVKDVLVSLKNKAILPFRQTANAIGAATLVALREDLGLPKAKKDTSSVALAKLAAVADASGNTLVQNLLKRWIKDGRILEQAKTVSDSVGAAISDIIEKALKSPDLPGSAEIARQIEDAANSIPYWKAEQIARTEIHTAMNEASLETVEEIAADADVAMDKIWASAEDDRTREAHRAMDGVREPLSGGMFSVDGKAMSGPGDPAGGPENVINCRCTLTYEPAD